MTTRLAKLASVAALSAMALTACTSPASTSSSPSAADTASASASTGTETTATGTETTAAGTETSAAPAADLACPAGKLVGEGSSAQENAMKTAVNGYNDKCNKKAQIEYSATGSGKGITAFTTKAADFAGSDSALKDKPNKENKIETELAKTRCGADAWNLPMVVGPVAFAYNLEGVDGLVLTPEVLAKIFYGEIKTWNDPAIAALNAGVTLPEEDITVFYRSDDSGTSDNVSKFLKAASKGAWKDEPGKKWTGTAGEGKDKSAGVATAVKDTPNSITYVEWSYAKNNDLGVAKLDNGAGAVELTPESVAKAVEGADIKGEGHDLKLGLKYEGTEAGAYPAILVTYEIVCSKGLDAEKTALLKDFLTYFASAEGQSKLVNDGYAPLPASMQTQVAEAVKAIA